MQDPESFRITLDQVGYIAALKKIVHPTLKHAAKDAIVSRELFEQFMRLRGAATYCLLTRADVYVYVVALQRLQADGTT